MSVAKNKAIQRHLFKSCSSADYSELADNSMTADLVVHSFRGDMSLDEFKAFHDMLCTAFPDIRNNLEDQVGEDEKVVSRLTMLGTHKGEFNGIPATGRKVEVPNIVISRFTNDRICEMWMYFDVFTMMQQLGVVRS